MRDTLASRWALLKSGITVHDPGPGLRPTVLLFHGCGGRGVFLDDYGAIARDLGVRAIVVDSFSPRGWSRAFATMTVCSGLLLWGRERAGDVLACVWGAIAELEADPHRLVLAGWSHGGWSVMDLMTMPLERPGEAGLADPSAALLEGLKGVFLAYPYGGLATLSRRGWVRRPPVLGLLAKRDLVTRHTDSETLFAAVARSGVELDLRALDGPHAFDERDSVMAAVRYDELLSAQAMAAFRSFLAETLTPA